jgi:hypothetical protein
MKKVITSPEYIYESPDNGLTVFRRRINSTERELVIEREPDLFSYADFQDMKELSKTNTSLKKALDNLTIIYYTIKDDKSTS